MQAEKLRAYCALHDVQLVGIVEETQSAKSVGGRPGFTAALEKVLAGSADGLLIWRLDRAFRSTQDALDVARRLNKKGRALVSVCEQLDTKSALGSFTFTLMASLAELERRLIGERTSAALQHMKANGQKVSSEAPYGFRYDQNNRAVPDDHEQECLSVLQSLHEANPKWKGRRLAVALAERGFLNRRGRQFDAHTPLEMLTRKCA
jgi:DNA invertase Pin-like site-specific DNA recombinase